MPNLTIYLLRDHVRAAGDAVGQHAKHHRIVDGQSVLGDLYVAPRPPISPKWTSLFTDYVDKKDLGQVQSTGALFITQAGGRFFALTFGQGRFILNQDSVEERFGLLVTLNSLEANALRSVDKKTFDAVDQISRVQVGQTSTATEFGIDIERDLIKGIVGYPKDIARLGRRLAGADSLTVSMDVKLTAMKPLLKRYLKAFQSDAYREHFSWIDQIRQVRPKGHIEERLKGLLIEKLQVAQQSDGLVDGCWLAVPDILDWAAVAGFRFSRNPKNEMATDLHLPGFMDSLIDGEVLSIELLKIRYAYALNDDHQEIQHWSVYKCLHCELMDGDKSYLLSGGHWFEVNQSFVQDVTEFYESLPQYASPLLTYNHASETEYNRALVESDKEKWALMDRVPIAVGGIHDKVEFCDAFGSDGEMLHVKRYGGSNLLGHLFNQGLVSGELLRKHETYVTLVNAHLPASHLIECNGTIPRDVSKFKIVFGIISQSEKEGLHIPFFARVALKNVYSRLESIGYTNIALAKIGCDPALKRLIRVKAKKGKRP